MPTTQTKGIEEIRLEDGKLPAYAWPGGYPIYYLDTDGCILCPDCANKEYEYCSPNEAYGIHYEGAPITCEDCNCEIESAYGNPEDGDN